MRWRILNLAETGPFPGVLDDLEHVAEVISLPPTSANLEQELPKADAYFSALALRLPTELIARCPRLKVVATPSTGWDHLDWEELKRREIELLSLRGEEEFLNSITATAELAWALLLAVVRRLRCALRFSEAGIWARDACRGHQLAGKTLGVLGYGRLGRMVAEYGRAFRMRVITHDCRTMDYPNWLTPVSFEECLQQADILSIHVHLTPANHHLIGHSQFAQMKPGGILVNTSRGAIVDEDAMLQALDSSQLAGAGLDVIDGEWDSDLPKHPVIRYARTHENVVITPHLGGITHESQRAAYAFIARKLRMSIERHSE